MAVAKFTHFFNPRLFPLYDESIMWKKVFNGAFSDEYRHWCDQHRFNRNEQDERFNLTNVLFAGDCLRQADDDFMAYFSRWFREQVGNGADEQKVLSDIHQYYATAFEFVAIGAAYLCGVSRSGEFEMGPSEPVPQVSGGFETSEPLGSFTIDEFGIVSFDI